MEKLTKAIIDRNTITESYRNEFKDHLAFILNNYFDSTSIVDSREKLRVLIDTFLLTSEETQMRDKQQMYNAFSTLDNFLNGLQELKEGVQMKMNGA